MRHAIYAPSNTKLFLSSILAVSLAACGTTVSPTNPFDPEAPESSRESASIQGHVFLEGRELHGGIDVRLDGISASAAITKDDGSFELVGLASGEAYIVVAQYTGDSHEEYTIVRTRLTSVLLPGENRPLPNVTLELLRPPTPPVLLDAAPTDPGNFNLTFLRSPEIDVMEYRVHVRSGRSSTFERAESSCIAVELPGGLLRCEVSGLSAHSVHSFKMTSYDGKLESRLSSQDIFQFAYLENPSILTLREQTLDAVQVVFSQNDESAYILAPQNLSGCTILKVNLTTFEQTSCATISAPSDEPFIFKCTDMLIENSAGQDRLWVAYYAGIPNNRAGVASVSTSDFENTGAADPCLSLNSEHTVVRSADQNGDVVQDGRVLIAPMDASTMAVAIGVENGADLYRLSIDGGSLVSGTLETRVEGWLSEFQVRESSTAERQWLGTLSETHEVFVHNEGGEGTHIGVGREPGQLTTIPNSQFAIVTAVGSGDLSVIHLETATEVERVYAMRDNPKLSAVVPVDSDDPNDPSAILYVAHFGMLEMTAYDFHLPVAEPASPAHRYLRKRACSGHCRMRLGVTPRSISVHTATNAVYVLESDSNRLLHFTLPQPSE